MSRKRRRRGGVFSAFNPLTIDNYTIGWLFIIVGSLYFFAHFMAPNSPLLAWFHKASYVVFGKVGTFPFFGLSVIFGILVLFK